MSAASALILSLGSFTPQAHAQALAAVRVATGLGQILFVTAPPNDYNRLFIVSKTGQVYILKLGTGLVNAAPFLDISSKISTDSEQGLLGMAFDPNYATNGKFYLDFIVSAASTPQDPAGNPPYNAGVTHVSQFQVSTSDADKADVNSEKVLLTFGHPQANHNGGWIGFSPRAGDENNLYIATGDGGNGNDTGSGHLQGGNAQNVLIGTGTLDGSNGNTSLPRNPYLGKMLRIHIDSVAGTASIPPSNPFFGSTTMAQEIFCYGLRNPFRDSFDRATGMLFIGDVGQSTREEVDVQKPSNPNGGENYGWRLREGLIATPTVGGNPPPGNVDPIVDYPRDDVNIPTSGGTVTGGYVYRGRQIPGLRGTYVFGDYLSSKIFTLNYDGTNASNFRNITNQLFPTATGGFGLSNPASFGEDANGEIYIVAIGNGSVFKIVPITPNVESAGVMRVPGGSAFVSAYGVPFKAHTVQSTNTLVEPFAFLATTNAASGSGLVQFEDTNPGTQRFYRIVYP